MNVDISGRSTRVLRQGNGPPLIWLVDLFEDLGLQRADVLGCGLGGWMAAEFAVRYPERLERLILVDACGLRVEGALAADEFALTMPSLVLWGESDQLVPLAHGRAYVAGLRRARLETIQGAAHYPYLEQTQAFIHLVEAFLEAR